MPIAGPSISFYHALKFAKDVNAKLVIPIHYDAFNTDPVFFQKRTENQGIEVRVLQNLEEAQV